MLTAQGVNITKALRKSLLVSIGCFAFTTSAFAVNLLWAPMDNFDTGLFNKSDNYSNGGMFNCTWRANNATFSGSQLRLAITSSANNVFDCAEYRTRNNYGYGFYEVNMVAAKNIGIVSSFFLYTGPSDGNPWDEIDVEFLGKDTTKVQFNYFKNGVGGHEKIVSLGFDASAGFHKYAIDWRANSIKWYVDGVLKHSVTGTSGTLPSHASKAMVNIWPGKGVDGWLGAYNGANPIYAYYDYLLIDTVNFYP